MSPKVGGQRPRPRVALLGQFNPYAIERFNRMFPTIWRAEEDVSDLETLVDVREI